jgi:hypothetical protein
MTQESSTARRMPGFPTLGGADARTGTQARVKRSESAFALGATQARIRVASIVTLLTTMPTMSAPMSATVG